MKKLLALAVTFTALGLVLFLFGCGPLPPIQPPQPPAQTCPASCPLGSECKDPAKGCQPIPAPGPVCQEGQTHSCWHWPPDSTTWLYACPVYNASGGIVGVVNVVGGPAQCPAKPGQPPVTPPTQTCQHPAESDLTAGPESCGEEYANATKAATDKLGPMTGSSCDVKNAALASQLYADTGRCAFAGQEAVFIHRSDNRWEERHTCSYADGGWTNTGRGVYKGCHEAKQTQPPPTFAGCTAPVTPKVVRWWGPKPHQRTNDSTPLFYGRETQRWDGVTITGYCEDIGMGDKLFCPARNECPETGENVKKCKERAACEAVGVSGREDGLPLWRSDGRVDLSDNPMQATCRNCTWLEVCAADGTACSRCAVDQNTGLCVAQ